MPFKNYFQKLLLVVVTLTAMCACLHAQESADNIELAESVPAETIMEQSDLPRTTDVWKRMIDGAKESIDIETFYFSDKPGEPMEEVIAALKNAATVRNVKVRIIIDSSFYAGSEKSSDELGNISNIEIRKIPLGNLAGGVMHAKYFVVDGKETFVGSQNMDWRALKHIHEIGVRVSSEEFARTFEQLFETDWNFCIGNNYGLSNTKMNFFVTQGNPVKLDSKIFGEVSVYPAFSPPKLNMPGVSSEETELYRIIKNTKDSLLIQMYSYSPKARNEKNYFDSLDNALRSAASSGVKIKIIFSDWAIKDPATDFIKSLSQVPNVIIKFSTIPQYSGGFIPYSRVEHCKYFISDDHISWISTSNWEWSYFNSCRNATVIIDSRKVNSKLNEVFQRDWFGPYTEPVDVGRKYIPVRKN